MQITDTTGPHGNSPIVTEGNTTNPAKALILLHGRGASAESILSLAHELNLSDDYIVAAPQATGYTWYPERFIVPTEDNQPYLDSALERIHTLVQQLKEQYNINTTDIVLAGFSQGACLAAEYVKRHPGQYGGLAVLSGGLIGSDAEISARFTGDFADTPIYLGCDEHDFHIPAERVEQSADIFTEHGADVITKLYKGLGHSIHPEGIQFLNNLT